MSPRRKPRVLRVGTITRLLEIRKDMEKRPERDDGLGHLFHGLLGYDTDY